MQINSVQHASREQLQDEVLALIRSRSTAFAQKTAQEKLAAGNTGSAAPVGPTQTEQAVKAINETMQVLSTSLLFKVDQESGRTVVKVVDTDTGEVLRQIPTEATLQIARSLDKLTGHLVNHSI